MSLYGAIHFFSKYLMFKPFVATLSMKIFSYAEFQNVFVKVFLVLTYSNGNRRGLWARLD